MLTFLPVGLLAMPALSEQVYAGNLVFESKNKGQLGEIKSKGKSKGGGINT